MAEAWTASLPEHASLVLINYAIDVIIREKERESSFFQKHFRGLNRVPARTHTIASFNQLRYRCHRKRERQEEAEREKYNKRKILTFFPRVSRSWSSPSSSIFLCYFYIYSINFNIIRTKLNINRNNFKEFFYSPYILYSVFIFLFDIFCDFGLNISFYSILFYY